MSLYADAFDSAEIDAALIDFDLFSHKRADPNFRWAPEENGWQRLRSARPGHQVTTDVFTVEVVANTWEDKEYEQVSQGGEDFYIVIKVVKFKNLSTWRVMDDTRFFKKTGHMSSYGDIEWTSGLMEVKGTPKTIFTFE